MHSLINKTDVVKVSTRDIKILIYFLILNVGEVS